MMPQGIAHHLLVYRIIMSVLWFTEALGNLRDILKLCSNFYCGGGLRHQNTKTSTLLQGGAKDSPQEVNILNLVFLIANGRQKVWNWICHFCILML